MDKGDYDLSQLVDDHILRSAFAGSVFMKDGMGGKLFSRSSHSM